MTFERKTSGYQMRVVLLLFISIVFIQGQTNTS